MAEATRTTAEREQRGQGQQGPGASAPAAEEGALTVAEATRLSAAPGDGNGGVSRSAAVLRDPRLDEAGPTQRIRLMRQLQRSLGNGQVEQALARTQPGSAAVQRKDDCAPPTAPAPVPPEKAPQFRAVAGRARKVAVKQKAHAPPSAKAREAQAAALPPANEVASQAGANQVGEMGRQKPGTFDRAGFIAKVEQAIAAITPKSEEEADKFKESGKVGEVAGQVSGMVGQSKAGAEGAIKETTEAAPDTGKVKPKPVTPMGPERAGPAPGGVNGGAAMPHPLPAAQVSLAHTPCATDGQMEDAGVTKEQLARGNEPAFNQALEAKQEADAHARQAPGAFRKEEQAALGDARGEAAGVAAQGLAGMHARRTGIVGQVGGDKESTKGRDEAKRAEFAKALEAIYGKTKGEVTAILDGLTKKVDLQFAEGEKQARATFEGYVEAQMAAYKEKRYSGVGGKFLKVTDTLKITKLPPEVDKFYQKGRADYLKNMRALIGTIADLVAGELNRAKARIAQGKQEIDGFVKKQPKALQALAKEAADAIGGKFDQLEQDVDAKADALAQGIAQKYSEALKAVDDRIAEMKAANQSLLDMAKAAVGDAIKTILELKNMLMGVLAKAAGAIEKIIKDPIGFLGNLLQGVKQGLMNFVGNIGTHLKKGLMSWLFGELAAGGIQMPTSFDLKGILALVMQILGLTWEAIKAQATRILGPKVVGFLVGAFDIFMVINDKGIGGLWDFVKDKLGELKETVLGGIKELVITQVIQAGVQWLLGVLGGPAGAFIKAAKAIFDIVMWFVNNGSRMMGLVNAVLDSVTAIANGSLGQAAAKVEESLAKALPLAIGFLASLLGLGNLSGKIKGVIEKVQAPVKKAVGWVLGKAKAFAAKLGKGLKGKFGKEESAEEKEKRLKTGVMAGVSAVNKLKGRTVTEALIKPVLGALRLRYRLGVLEPVVQDGYWAVHGEIQRMTVPSKLPREGTKIHEAESRRGQQKIQNLFENRNDAMNWARKQMGNNIVRSYDPSGKWIGWKDEKGNQVYWGHGDWGQGKGMSTYPHINYNINGITGHLFLADKIRNRGQWPAFAKEFGLE